VSIVEKSMRKMSLTVTESGVLTKTLNSIEVIGSVGKEVVTESELILMELDGQVIMLKTNQ
jgi:hypothetical protein